MNNIYFNFIKTYIWENDNNYVRYIICIRPSNEYIHRIDKVLSHFNTLDYNIYKPDNYLKLICLSEKIKQDLDKLNSSCTNFSFRFIYTEFEKNFSIAKQLNLYNLELERLYNPLSLKQDEHFYIKTKKVCLFKPSVKYFKKRYYPRFYIIIKLNKFPINFYYLNYICDSYNYLLMNKLKYDLININRI